MKITLKIPDETKTLWRSLWHNRWLRYSVYALGITIPLGIYAAALISIPHTFTGGQLVRAGEVNTNFKTLYDTLGITEAKGLTVGANIEAQGFTLNGTPVGSSSDSFWSVAGTGNIAYNSGNVGIGITPTTKFHVNGTTTLDGDAIIKGTAATGAALDVQNSGGTSMMYVGNNGNVGIGTAVPTAFLNVRKSGAVTNTIQNLFDLTYNTTPGPPATGLGTGMYFRANNTGPSLRIMAGVAGVWTNATAGTNDGALVFGTGNAAVDTWEEVGFEKMRIDSNGNVGIGTMSPTALLHTSKNTFGKQLRLERTGTGAGFYEIDLNGSKIWHVSDQDQIFGPNNSTGFMTIKNTSGRVGIGTDTPTAEVEVRNTSGSSTVRITAQNGTNAALVLTEDSNVKWSIFNQGSSDRIMIVDANGNDGLYMDQNTSAWMTNSDRRLKKNIKTIPDALTSLMAINGVLYNWKTEASSHKKHLGVIAQEVEAKYPEATSTGSDGIKGVRYTELIPVLIEATKALKREKDKEMIQKDHRIADLENKNQQLEAALSAQNARLDRIERLMARANL